MGGLLERIHTTGDIKKLRQDELGCLCRELRHFLVKNVSKTGGHLASNLGVVELTVALEYVFDLPEDKIVWDVGHQAYIHKILTGRKESFPTLRCLDGISGFPKPNESDADAFATGHSSTSVSAALGIAAARDLLGKKNRVVAVIGDGSMTGGLAYEALNNAGRSNTNLIIILNDNEMSIDHNVGAMSRHLSGIRSDRRYRNLKNSIKEFRDNIPVVGEMTFNVLEKIRDSARLLLVDGAIFEELGISYLGPIDGHDINEMLEIFNNIKDTGKPVLIHVKTVKGKGYKPAEVNPEKFHGIGPFDLKTGEPVSKGDKPSWSEVFGRKLADMGRTNKSIVAVTAAMCGGTGLEEFKKAFPERFFDVAIAEQHGTTFAAAMASQGMTPVFAVYSSFLQRAYDQIVHDVCMEGYHVVFAVDRAGIVGADGETHQGVFDLSFLTHIPNMTLLSPKNGWELEEMLDYAVNKCSGPVAVRYPRGTASVAFEEDKTPIEYGKAEVIQQGERVAVLAEGHMLEAVCEAAKLLRDINNIDPMVVNMRFISPLDGEMLEKLAKGFEHIFTVEDNIRKGGFGSRVLEFYSDRGIRAQVTNLAFPDHYIEQGSQGQLFQRYGLDAKGIYNTILNKTGEHNDR